MTDDFLTTAQVDKLTGKKRPSAQWVYLKGRGIPCERNGAGEVLVLWSTVERMMGIKRPTEARAEPNWGAILGTQANKAQASAA
jgi:hypothetical protein